MKYVAHLSDDEKSVYVFAIHPENGEITYLGLGAFEFDSLDAVREMARSANRCV